MLDHANRIYAGYRIRSAVVEGGSPCQGATIGYSLELSAVSLGARLSACRSGFDNDFVAADADELSIQLSGTRGFDLPPLTFSIGLVAGAALLRQSFETRGRAPDRTSAAGLVGLTAGVDLDLGHGFLVGLNGTGQTYFFRVHRQSHDGLVARFAIGGAGFVGKQW